MSGYVPGEQPRDDGIIKLNTNENPYPPSPKVYAALRKAIDASLRLYPRADERYSARRGGGRLWGSNRKYHGRQRLGRALVDAAALFCRARRPGRLSGADLFALRYLGRDPGRESRRGLPFPEDFSLPADCRRAKRAADDSVQSQCAVRDAGVAAEIVRLAGAVAGILVVDEAYVDFAASEGASALPLIHRLPNLVVLRTLSKSFSLAGMRIGLAFASEEIIAGMMKVKDSYNLNRLSMVAALRRWKTWPGWNATARAFSAAASGSRAGSSAWAIRSIRPTLISS